MSFKLALRNVKKSYRDYFVYFFTLALSVAMFYIFNTFQQQSSVLQLTDLQQALLQKLGTVMIVLSIIIMLIFAFLMIYANNFLIKRRKKEFGTYLVLGMSQQQVGFIIILETFLVALASLLVGLIIGIFFSQLAAFLTARFLNVGIDFTFFFSAKALKLSIIMFLSMFFVIALLNQRSIRTLNLIDLLYADKKNDTLKSYHPIKSLLIFILSLIMIMIAYAIAQIEFRLLTFFPLIMFLGIAGTFLFLKTISEFYFVIISRKKNYYFKALNPFVIRQVKSQIKSSYKTVAVVSILLLFSFVTFVSAANLNTILSGQISKIAPFDISIERKGQLIDHDIEDDILNSNYSDVLELKQYQYHDYASLEPYFMPGTLSEVSKFSIIKESDFNHFLDYFGLEYLNLRANEVFVFNHIPETYLATIGFDYSGDYEGQMIDVLGHQLKMISYHSDESIMMANAQGITVDLIVPDVVVDSASDLILDYHTINANGRENFGTFSALEDDEDYIVNTKYSVTQGFLGIQLMFSYISLYLGMVFLVSATLILALQQISEANDNQMRYQVISDLGAQNEMIYSALRKQISLYFILPYLIALVHAFFGIRAVNVNLNIFLGGVDNIKITILVLLLITLFYYLYYRFTFKQSLNIIASKIHLDDIERR